MGRMTSYTISNNGGPKFNKPSCRVPYPYSKETDELAIEIDNTWDYVDSILLDVSQLEADIENIKKEIDTLAENWNNCILYNSAGQEYVFLDDLKKDTNIIDKTIQNGKTDCDNILSDFCEITKEINNYISELNQNYKAYSDLLNRKYHYTQKLNQLNSQNENDYASINQTIRSINNKLDDYQEIKNISELGSWVTK